MVRRVKKEGRTIPDRGTVKLIDIRINNDTLWTYIEITGTTTRSNCVVMILVLQH